MIKEKIHNLIYFLLILALLSIPSFVLWKSYSEQTNLSEIVSLPTENPEVLDQYDIRLGEHTVLQDDQYFVFADDIQKEPAPEKVIEYCGEYPCYSDEEFLKLQDAFEAEHALPILSKYIYQNEAADAYIKKFAESRGYRQRPFADEADIIPFEGIFTRQEVKKAYTALRDELLKEGIRLHFVSGYRSSTDQRAIFKEKMGSVVLGDIAKGLYDIKLDEVLSRSALPGYSKHHSGYAVDFGCGDKYLVYSFAETPCFAWLSENNFEKAKSFGFVPSYPEAAVLQGPNPEPWEFVWVGADIISRKPI
jgi:LAS superfamily LD-carboxypeptidase LdcB